MAAAWIVEVHAADFLDGDSLTVSPLRMADYEESAGKVPDFAVAMNHNQPGDPQKLAAVLVNFVDVASPPVHLPLGSDSATRLAEVGAEHAMMLAEWRHVSNSTDFEAPAVAA